VRYLNAFGISATHIPYKDGGITDMIAGLVTTSFEPSTTAIPQLAGGRLRGLAVTGAQRLPALPNVPTISESLPGFVADSWQGVLVRKGTPAAVVHKIAKISREITASDEFRAKALELGLVAVQDTPAEFQRFIVEDAKVWAKVVKDNDIRAE
jgi:tripartite-type tricarboxylate transporter receptor subunit TctC